MSVAKDNNIRLSFQTAYRFPTNQNQYINLRLGRRQQLSYRFFTGVPIPL